MGCLVRHVFLFFLLFKIFFDLLTFFFSPEESFLENPFIL